jgi:hypothetical protein
MPPFLGVHHPPLEMHFQRQSKAKLTPLGHMHFLALLLWANNSSDDIKKLMSTTVTTYHLPLQTVGHTTIKGEV